MGGQLWSIGKDVDVKHDVTSHVIGQVPDCCGKSILLMTSRTYTDFIQLAKQNKIDGESTVFNIENLQSKDILKQDEKFDGESNEQAFSRLWEKEIYEICDNYSIDHVKYSLHFDNEIFDTSLYHWGKNNPFSFVYADTCNQPTDRFFKWINSYSTYDGVADDGIIAVTLVLERTKSLKPSESCKDCYDSNLIMLCSGNDKCHGYKNMAEYNKYLNWMRAIAENVESKNLWKLIEMIHYREKSETASNMVTAVFRKQPEL